MLSQFDGLDPSIRHRYPDIPIRDGSHSIHGGYFINIIDADRAPGTGAKITNNMTQVIKPFATIHIASGTHEFGITDET